jgi:SsrA-binding protein
MLKKTSGASLIAPNKKARHLYEILDTMEAGLVLTGTEVKSLRAGQVSFRDSYVVFKNGEAWLVGLYIAPYQNAGYAAHDPDADRKLLLHAWQINSLAAKVAQKGLSVVPLKLYFSKGRVKLEIALARGKKLYDQRETLKRNAENRDADREMARFR